MLHLFDTELGYWCVIAITMFIGAMWGIARASKTIGVVEFFITAEYVVFVVILDKHWVVNTLLATYILLTALLFYLVTDWRLNPEDKKNDYK